MSALKDGLYRFLGVKGNPPSTERREQRKLDTRIMPGKARKIEIAREGYNQAMDKPRKPKK